MKIKQTLLTFGGFIAVLSGVVFAPTTTFAATCGGVQTSIISCAQTGACSADPNEGTNPGGNSDAKKAYRAQFGHDYGKAPDPYEGTNPTGNTDKEKAYLEQYGHKYGLCPDESKPNDAVNSSGIWGVLLLILNIMTTGVGVLAVAGIVYGSVLYASAGDSAEQVKKAKGIILNVVIGLIAFGLMYALLNFLIPGGIFTEKP
jgi:hypothetical protein